MKKILSILACALMIGAASSCINEPTPDGECGLLSFGLSKTLNPSLPADIAGAIDASAKTVSLTIPTSVTTTSFVPSFVATEFDEVVVGNTTLDGVSAVTITDGTTIKVSDMISNLEVSYKIVVKSNDEKAELLSVVFAKADNADLTEDVAPAEIASEMLVRVPAAAFQKELVIKATAGQNDVIKINGEVAADGSATVDTMFPVDITVTDEIAGTSNSYVVKVGKILENVWTSLGIYSAGAKSSFVDMAVDAADGTPYISFEKTFIGENDYTGGCVVKWNGTAFELVGEDVSGAGVTDFRIAANNGKLYSFFKDAGATKTTLYSVMAYDGVGWSFAGDRGFCEATTGTSYYKTSFAIDPATGNVFTATSANAANTTTGQVKRGLSIGEYNGAEWDANKPIMGRSNYGYSPRLASASDGVYCLVANQTEKTYSLYKEVSSSWSTVVASFLPVEGASDVGTIQLDAACNSKDEFFAAINCAVGDKWLCRVFKLEDGKFAQIGNDIPADFGTKYAQFALTFDANDNPVIAYNDALKGSPVKAVVFDDETKDWGNAFSFAGTPENTYLRAGRSSDGKCYVVYPVKEGDTFSFALYSYGLEADIIPE